MRSSEFKNLVIPLSSRLYRLAYGLLQSREEAEDAVQEVYVKLWKMRSDLSNYNSLEALSVSITRNICLDHLRREKVKRNIYQTEVKEDFDDRDPASEYEVKERAEKIHQLINQLPEPQRSLVYFRHIEGKDYNEISKMMDMTENNIRVQMSRARKKLREMLQKKYVSWTN